MLRTLKGDKKIETLFDKGFVLKEKNIQCIIVSSVKKGVEALERYSDGYVKIIFGSHYIAEEVYTAVGKYFDTTNN